MAKPGITQTLEAHIEDTTKHGDVSAHNASETAHANRIDPLNASINALADRANATDGSLSTLAQQVNTDRANTNNSIITLTGQINAAAGNAHSAQGRLNTVENAMSDVYANLSGLWGVKNNCRAATGVVDYNPQNPYLPGVAANNVWFWVGEDDGFSDGEEGRPRSLQPGVGQHVPQPRYMSLNRVYYLCVGWE